MNSMQLLLRSCIWAAIYNYCYWLKLDIHAGQDSYSVAFSI